MADPLATIDAWGSPSASASALPATRNDVHDAQPASGQNGKGENGHDSDEEEEEEEDDDAPLSTSLRRNKEDEPLNARPPPAQRTQSAMERNRQPFLKVRITGLERNRKDLLIRFDANVSLLR